mgnify:CR=1 FL=1
MPSCGQILRTAGMVEELRTECSQREETRHIAEILSPGSPAVNTLWIKEHEPQSFARIHKIMTPYAYIVYKLTGQYSMDTVKHPQAHYMILPQRMVSVYAG